MLGLDKLTLVNDVESIYQLTRHNGGCTYNCTVHESVKTDTDLWIVGTGQHKVGPTEDWKAEIAEYVSTGGLVGTWVDLDGWLHLDRVQVFGDKFVAKDTAALYGQLAIYNLLTGELATL